MQQLTLKTLVLSGLLVAAIGCCVATAQTPERVYHGLYPSRIRCLDLLELEKLPFNRQTNSINLNVSDMTSIQLAIDYAGIPIPIAPPQ